MWKIQKVNNQNLLELVPAISSNQTTKFIRCKGLLRLAKHHTFASVMVGVGTAGVVLAYKYGSIIFSPVSKWLSILMSARAADSIHCSPREELTIPGLQNMGNNCFLNVVLQALASSYFFQSFIDSCVQISDKSPEENAEFMPLAAAVSVLLEELSVLGSEGRVASPRRVMMALESYATNFDLARQQDAAEALGHLLSSLKEECLEYIEQYMPHHGSLSSVLTLCDSESTNHKVRGEQISLESWNRYLQRPLDGTLGSVLTCQSCSFQMSYVNSTLGNIPCLEYLQALNEVVMKSSTQFEFFHDLPISPIVGSDGDIIEGCTIDDCLKKFTAPEQIGNYQCSNCSHLSAIQDLSLKYEANKNIIQKIKDCDDDDSCSCEALVAKGGMPWAAVYKNACKQLRIGRCPKVLCIHLQRASMNEIGELIKLRDHVSFPIVFDLFPYTVAAQQVKREYLLHEMQMKMRQIQSMPSHIQHFKLQFDRNLLPWSPFFVKESSFYSASMSGNCVERSLCNTVDQLFQPQENKPVNDESYSMTKSITCRNSESPIQSNGEKIRVPMVQSEYPNNASLGSKNMSSLSQDIDGNQSYSGSHSEMPPSPVSDLQSIKNQNANKNTDGLDNAGCIGSRRCLPYELLSVVQHNGSTGSGHYTVYRKVKVSKKLMEAPTLCMTSKMDFSEQAILVEQKEITNSEDNAFSRTGDKNTTNADIIWFRISDSIVERVTEKCVLGAHASLLFYGRLEDAD